MGYQIKVKDVNGIIHTLEAAEGTVAKGAKHVLDWAAGILSCTAASLSIISSTKKEEKK